MISQENQVILDMSEMTWDLLEDFRRNHLLVESMYLLKQVHSMALLDMIYRTSIDDLKDEVDRIWNNESLDKTDSDLMAIVILYKNELINLYTEYNKAVDRIAKLK